MEHYPGMPDTTMQRTIGAHRFQQSEASGSRRLPLIV
jgi:hypothetical protein